MLSQADGRDYHREFLLLAARYGVLRPSEAVWERYAPWRAKQPSPQGRLDRALLFFATGSRFGAWIASAYAGRFFRTSVLRRREVALLAFLEADSQAFTLVDESRDFGPLRAWLCFFGWGIQEALAVGLGLFIFGPIHLMGARS